jgi:hypothetical protein
VITTDEAPMNEIAGAAAYYLPRLKPADSMAAWAANGAAVLRGVLAEPPAERARRFEAGQAWAQRFDPDRTIDAYLAIYAKVLESSAPQPQSAPSLGQGT